MRKLISGCASLCTMVLVFASPVRAQSVLWVSASGSDANACSQTSPCGTFQGAINKGNVAQINCLTSGSYGSFVISASITIDCGTGNVGNVVVSSGSAITISTSSAVTITLRHLSLNGNGTAAFGIVTPQFSSGTLIVEDCMVQGFGNGDGISFSPSGGRGLLQVSNSQVFSNIIGIIVSPASGQIASVTLNRVELVGNTHTGLLLGSNGVVAGTMRDSLAGSNGQTGVYSNAGQVFFTIEESSLINNLSAGVQTQSPGSVVNVGASTIGANGTGVSPAQGSIISFGNNQMSANRINGNFTSTTPLR